MKYGIERIYGNDGAYMILYIWGIPVTDPCGSPRKFYKLRLIRKFIYDHEFEACF